MKSKWVVFFLATSGAMIAAVVLYFILQPVRPNNSNINSYEDCVAAGFPVMESYPERCTRADGRSFTRRIEVAEHIESKADMIVLSSPLPMEVVSSPLEFTGMARGGWFFEASFPVFLVNWDGLIIAEGIATAVLDPADPNSTWMTEDFVSFSGTLEFSDPSWEADFSKRGTLIFQKDNPSGLPEHDDALEIPILFAPTSGNE